ncbi:MAG: outer membrane beta-barrel protein, partial [Parabacteroides sp.]|nr:outer membrane beta-barrel protein [Parabacteroides sp.]
ENAYCYFDLAFRQQFLKNGLTVSVVAHDIFHTAKYDNRRISSALESFTHVRPKYPNIVFSISYAFNAAGHKEQNNAVSGGNVFEGKDF